MDGSKDEYKIGPVLKRQFRVNWSRTHSFMYVHKYIVKRGFDFKIKNWLRNGVAQFHLEYLFHDNQYGKINS